jgi:hypothetical protein
MSLSRLSTSQVNRVFKLLKKKEKLAEAITKIDLQIRKIEGETASDHKPARSVSSKKTRKRGKPGKTGAKVLQALTAAGAKGIRVVDLSKKLKIKPANLYVWFQTTGKKVKEIQKTAPGHYVYKPKT